MVSSNDLSGLQEKIWDGSIPLEIRLSSAECRAYDKADPYLIHVRRLSYLPFLLPRLHAFFASSLIDPDVAPSDGWFTHEEVPLKWHYPVGLLYDLYSGSEPAQAAGRATLTANAQVRTDEEEAGRRERPVGTMSDGQPAEQMPWKLTLHFTEWPDDHLVRLDMEGKIMHDAFRNSVKEASFVRYNSGKVILSLSKEDSDKLWEAVAQHKLSLFAAVNNKLLNPPGIALRSIPLRIYLPSTAPGGASASATSAEPPTPGHLRVVQSLITPYSPPTSRTPQTLGTALNTLLPSLFPSRRSPLLALPVLHGAVVPLLAEVEDLGRAAAYSDGWLHISIVMMG